MVFTHDLHVNAHVTVHLYSGKYETKCETRYENVCQAVQDTVCNTVQVTTTIQDLTRVQSLGWVDFLLSTFEGQKIRIATSLKVHISKKSRGAKYSNLKVKIRNKVQNRPTLLGTLVQFLPNLFNNST